MYKKLLLYTFFIIVCLAPISAKAYSQEMIKRYDVIIDIQKNSDLEITERIVYEFGTNNRHGIYRNIPVKYKDGIQNYSLKIKNVHVENDEGNEYTTQVEKDGSYINIRIGDEDVLVTGEKIYNISYTVQRGLIYSENYDELYWNAIGNEWVVPIQNSTTTIILPKEVQKEDTIATCYAGSYEVAEENCTVQLENGAMMTTLIEPLESYEGYSVAYSFPKNTVQPPTQKQKILWWLGDNGAVFIPILMFMGLFWYWWKNGKDPKGKGTIVAQYEAPENLTPVQVGTLIDERVDKKDFSASIIYLATQGYIKVKQKKKGIKKDWILINQMKNIENLPEFEKKLHKKLLGAKEEIALSDLKNKFYKHIPTLKDIIFESLISKNYFLKNPEATRKGGVFALGIVIFFLGILSYGMLNNALTLIAGIITGIECIVFSQIMPKKTKKGVLVKEQILGFKEYLNVAEKDRINFHNAPEKTPELFEKYLPYAMVLGVEKAWAKQFQDIYNQTPSWYEGNINSFNIIYFTNSLTGGINSGMNSAMTKPGGGASGGGGFSGGGFGGGGGGSW